MSDGGQGFVRPRVTRTLLRWIAALPGGKSVGHGFEFLAGPFVGIGDHQRFRRRRVQPMLEPRPVCQARHGMAYDRRPEFRVSVLREPRSRAGPMVQGRNRGPNRIELVYVM